MASEQLSGAGDDLSERGLLWRYALALEAGGVGTWEWDRESGRVRWDEALEAIYGLPPGGFGGRLADWEALLHPEDREEVLAAVERAVRGGDHDVIHRVIRPDGGLRWVHGKGTVLRDPDGEVVGMIGVAHDVTERHEAEAERTRLLAAEQRARRRLEFLAEASQLLAESLVTGDTLAQLAQLVVPGLADWCAIELVEEGRLRQVAVVHVDPAKVGVALQLRHEYGISPDEGVGKVLRTGEPEFLPVVSDEHLRAMARDDRHHQLHREVGFRSVLLVPLKARGAVIGALTMVHADSGRRHTADDLLLAQDLARRAAVAIDNARLYEERSKAVEVLQGALLPPELPDIPGCELAAHYTAGGGPGLAIGGDFYDAFPNADGSWSVLIGDVRGKGTEAAVINGIARQTVRAVSLSDPDPRRVLATLNEALLLHDPAESFCTTIIGVMHAEDAWLRLRLLTAGHPPALILRGDGRVETCGHGGLLLGLFDELDLAEDEVILGPGDALVLYTDGITEARREGDELGAGRLRAALRDCAGCSAPEVARRIAAAAADWSDGVARDDVAVLVVRNTDRPVGARAG